MIMIANLQYGWTLFVNPMRAAHPDWALSAIQWAFAIFIALETWLTPVAGWFADVLGPHRGPKAMVAIGGILVAIGWILNSYGEVLIGSSPGVVMGGFGGAAANETGVGHAVKWFPDRRGLAVGLTAAGYGGGAVLSVIPIRYVIGTAGYE